MASYKVGKISGIKPIKTPKVKETKVVVPKVKTPKEAHARVKQPKIT